MYAAIDVDRPECVVQIKKSRSYPQYAFSSTVLKLYDSGSACIYLQQNWTPRLASLVGRQDISDIWYFRLFIEQVVYYTSLYVKFVWLANLMRMSGSCRMQRFYSSFGKSWRQRMWGELDWRQTCLNMLLWRDMTFMINKRLAWNCKMSVNNRTRCDDSNSATTRVVGLWRHIPYHDFCRIHGSIHLCKSRWRASWQVRYWKCHLQCATATEIRI